VLIKRSYYIAVTSVNFILTEGERPYMVAGQIGYSLPLTIDTYTKYTK
jgi:hypothetical protein